MKLVSVRSVSAPLPDNLAHHPIPNCCRNIYTILECASLLGVCCFCHAAHVWTSLLLLHGSQGLSHAGANGLARKSGTFSVLSHTQLNGLSSRKSADDDWEELKLSTFCDVSSVTRCFGGYNVKLIGSTGGSCLIEWANRLQGPQSASSTESESIGWRRAAKAMLLVKGALDDCRLEPVPCGGYVDTDALRSAARHIRKARASPCPRRHVFSYPGAASHFAASGEYNRERGRHHDQGSLGGMSPRTQQNRH